MLTCYATVPARWLRPTMPDIPTLVVASSAFRRGKLQPVNDMPSHIRLTAADCGGFIASRIWGDYKYSADQYVEWLETFRPEWAAIQDWCCEEEITGKNDGIVLERQQKTTEAVRAYIRDYADTSWKWTPTIQGWQLADYIRHAQEMKPLIVEMKRRNILSRVGIGTLCRRASTAFIYEVVANISAILDDVPFHLWGIKLNAIKGLKAKKKGYARIGLSPRVISTDSAAYAYRMHKEGVIADAERTALGLAQQDFDLNIRAPRYQERVKQALLEPKQSHLF